MNKQRRADLLLVMTTFFWGASYYLTDICLDDLPPMTLNAFRFIVAFVVLGLILEARGPCEPHHPAVQPHRGPGPGRDVRGV